MAEILPEDFGGESLPNGVRIHGWRFETMDGAILRTSELAELKLRLQAAAGTEELLPKLPEAVFGHNKLTMTHESTGYQIKFDAEGALLEWLKNSLVAGSGGLTINAAELGSWRDKVAQMSGDSSRPDWDWTYSTTYSGISMDANEQPLPWAQHSGPGIDMAMLKRRDPILFFADLPLYQDDLHDNGHSECRLRIRVMPQCFFVLLRHFLRVDGSLIRQRDTRLFCKFGNATAGTSPTPPLIRMLRAGTCALPPLPTTPDEGRLVEGGAEDTPRPPILGTAILPDEQAAAQRLDALPPETEIVESLPLGGA